MTAAAVTTAGRTGGATVVGGAVATVVVGGLVVVAGRVVGTVVVGTVVLAGVVVAGGAVVVVVVVGVGARGLAGTAEDDAGGSTARVASLVGALVATRWPSV